ncbi:MAG: hypothetical protein DRP47_09930 [Candidatus Zixiibacteriota bacterium]|nr:MAG: hypothetical protein DRP47_09930 [candidate division Zixibacteria bacterium]
MTLFSKNKLAFLVTLVGLILISTSVVNSATIQIPKDTPVKVKFKQGLRITSGEFNKGSVIPITLAQPIDKNGIILVETGAEGTAQVVEIEKAGGNGKPGYIKIEFVDIKPKGAFSLREGEAIKLEGELVEAKGKGKGFFPWLFLKFILKGGEAEIATDKVYEVKVAESAMMQSE